MARLHRIGFICLDDDEEESPESVDPRRVARGREMLRQTRFLRPVADLVEEVELHSPREARSARPSSGSPAASTTTSSRSPCG